MRITDERIDQCLVAILATPDLAKVDEEHLIRAVLFEARQKRLFRVFRLPLFISLEFNWNKSILVPDNSEHKFRI